MKSPLLSPAAVAEELSLSPSTIHRMIRDGRLESIAVTPSRVRISRESLDAFLTARTIKHK